ncbi:hypothetical protein OS493_015442 [Desmophyllum pertusum]|uniref:Uncharacterized protein n=1 Tax=Desmophyllum pertusum TaxID=174260 RepID=A0A9X0CSW3_9CNID|nr:hypothetical protein OS493_015442 [Desmophyllum pertusum]
MAASGNPVRQAVDLDNLIQEYMHFEKVVRKTGQENSCLKKEIRSLNKQLQSSHEAEKIANGRGEWGLKSQITVIREKSIRLEQEHKNQISEAIKNYEQEILRVREEALQHSKPHEYRKSNVIVGDAVTGESCNIGEVTKREGRSDTTLQKQLADAGHAHHTEIVKLRLEYDEKLLKLQRERNNAKAQAGQSFNANTDIFRKKLQFVKAESQKEINSLKSKVAEFETKLAVQQMPATKRKMF